MCNSPKFASILEIQGQPDSAFAFAFPRDCEAAEHRSIQRVWSRKSEPRKGQRFPSRNSGGWSSKGGTSKHIQFEKF
jgi:hypothetical protein